jgi:hypothetical protein
VSEHTREQYEAIKATEDKLLALSVEIALLYSGKAETSWNVASTLVGRDLDAMPIGELRTILQEFDR